MLKGSKSRGLPHAPTLVPVPHRFLQQGTQLARIVGVGYGTKTTISSKLRQYVYGKESCLQSSGWAGGIRVSLVTAEARVAGELSDGGKEECW